MAAATPLQTRPVSLHVGSQPGYELIIDPGVAYSTFLGGTSHEIGAGIAVDAAGNAYIVGVTQSPDFTTTTVRDPKINDAS